MFCKSIQTIISVIFIFTTLSGKENNTNRTTISLQKPTQISDVWLDVNRLSGVFRNNGIWYFDFWRNSWGLEWPNGSGNSPVYAAGQWIGAKVNGEVKVAGSIFTRTDFQPGNIDTFGINNNPDDKKYRCYELRSDGSGDWNKWPTEQGAPLNDNGDPLLIGDQTIFCVWNDLTNHPFFGSNELGVEIRQLAFAFNETNVLGDMQFIKWQLVNKSDQVWDSTFFTIWMDPDLGAAGDDLFGCDTVLNLGYTYNDRENDYDYGAPPPAFGVDLLQGALVDMPGSVVNLPDGTVLSNKKQLHMSSFMVLGHTDAPTGDPETAEYAWSFMRAMWPVNHPMTYGGFGTTGTQRTYYMFPGDPITQSGWIEPYSNDQRMILTTGPFQMVPWQDTNNNGVTDIGEPGVQEIIVAVIVAKGTDRLDSVRKLKQISQVTQIAYEKNFNYKHPPNQPQIVTSELPSQIILSWDEQSEYNDDGTQYNSEDFFVSKLFGDTIFVNNFPIIIDDSTYNFYGYKVYQYSDNTGSDPVIIASWNIGKNKDAQPYTKQRYLIVNENKNPVVGKINTKLVNGKTYYFGVAAEGYLEFGSPKIISSKSAIVSVTPQFIPGIANIPSQIGDTLAYEHLRFDTTRGFSDGKLEILIADPLKTSGCEYMVTFKNDSLQYTRWNLVNITIADTLLVNQKNQTKDDSYHFADGLLIKVFGETNGIKDFQCVANANGQLYPAEGAAADWQGFPGTGKPTDAQQAGTGHWLIHTGPVSFFGFTPAYESFLERTLRGDNMKRAVPYDWEMRFTNKGSWTVRAFEDGLVFKVPFELWNIGINTPDDFSDDYRLIPWLLSTAAAGGIQTDTLGLTFQIDPNDHPVSEEYDDPYTPWIYWIIPEEHLDGSAGEAGYNAFLSAIDTITGTDGIYYYGGREVFARIVLVNWNGDDISDQVIDPATQIVPEPGTVFRIITTKPNTENDYFIFRAPPAASMTKSQLKIDLQKIKVVPNPYYAFHSGESSQIDRWVQFTYLPPTCTLRIFTLSGHLVRTLEKNDPTTPFLRWDLLNEYDVPIASGIYVFHVEAPGIGEKIGKMVIFMSTYRPDTWRSYNNTYER